MLSDLFKKDFRQLSAQGVKFSAADIVRLNALAVKVKLSEHPVGAAHMRRAAFVGDLAFREPTLGHEFWIERIGLFIDMTSDRNFRIVHGFALTREHAELPNEFKPEKCVREVYEFARKHLARITSRQLADAIDYVLFGADWKACELPPPRKSAAVSEAVGEPSPALGVYFGSAARKIGLSLAEAKQLTASELLEIVNRIDIRGRKFDPDYGRKDALAAYVRAREEIRSRGKEVKG